MSLLGRNKKKRRKNRNKKNIPYVRFRQSRDKSVPLKNKKIKGRKKRTKRSFAFIPFTPMGLFFAVISTALLITSVWFFVFSTYFLVDELAITEATTLSKTQLDKVFFDLQDERRLFLIPGNHILFLNATELQEHFRERYHYIDSINNYNRTWPDKISFSIKEKYPTFMAITSDGGRYYLDGEGVVLGLVKDRPAGGVVNLKASPQTDIVPGEKFIQAPILNFAVGLEKNWPNSWPFKPNIYEIVRLEGVPEIKISTSEGWYIKADTGDTAENMLNNLKLILENEIKTEKLRKNIAYIDLRLSTRAFYCVQGQPCVE